MKKLMIATAVLMLVACSKNEKQEEEKSALSNIVTSAQNYGKVSSSINDVSKNIETLKKMTPLTNDELKAVLPEQLLGLKRTEFSVGDNSMMNLSTAEAKYKNEDASKSVSLEIMDGAGETGSAMVSILMMGLNVNKEKITESGFEKSAEINGTKAIVSEDKNGDDINSEIQMVVKNRYVVTLKGDGISYDDLKKGVDEINTSNLK